MPVEQPTKQAVAAAASAVDRPLRRRDAPSSREDHSAGTAQEPHGQEDGIFPFFHLPRELRDQIYENSLVFKQKFPSQHGVRLRGRRVVDPALLLVSKQFRHEYRERADQHSTLVVVDRNAYHGELVTLPKPIAYATRLEIHVALACNGEVDHMTNGCCVLKELRMHRKWILDLCRQMRRLEAMVLKVVLDPRDQGTVCERKFEALQFLFTNLVELQRLEVFHAEYGMTGADWNFGRGRRLAMTWSQGDGAVQRVVMVEDKAAPVAQPAAD